MIKPGWLRRWGPKGWESSARGWGPTDWSCCSLRTGEGEPQLKSCCCSCSCFWRSYRQLASCQPCSPSGGSPGRTFKITYRLKKRGGKENKWRTEGEMEGKTVEDKDKWWWEGKRRKVGWQREEDVDRERETATKTKKRERQYTVGAREGEEEGGGGWYKDGDKKQRRKIHFNRRRTRISWSY